MVVVEVSNHENGVVTKKRVDEIIRMEMSGESGEGMVIRGLKKVALGRSDRRDDAFKIMRRRIDVNEGKRDRIAKANGNASTSFIVESVSMDNGEAAKRNVDTGAKPHFAEKKIS